MRVFYNTCKAINNTKISNETICAVWVSGFGSMTEKGYLLNSKDSDEKPHGKTSKIGVQCAKTEISPSVWCTAMSHLFMHKFLEEGQVFNTRQLLFIQSRVFS